MSAEIFTARYSRWRLAVLAAGAAAFVFGGLLIAGMFGPPPRPGGEWFGWFGVAFFGLGGLIALRRMFDDKEAVRISAAGIYFKQWSEQTIPWFEIRDVTVWEFRGQQSIILHLHHPDRYPSTKLLGRLASANRALTGGDIPITLVGTDGSVADAMAAIATHRRSV